MRWSLHPYVIERGCFRQARRRDLEPMDQARAALHSALHSALHGALHRALRSALRRNQARTRRKLGSRAQCPACPLLLNTLQACLNGMHYGMHYGMRYGMHYKA